MLQVTCITTSIGNLRISVNKVVNYTVSVFNLHKIVAKRYVVNFL